MVAPGDFIEIFCDTPIAVCEARDTKGLYQKAKAGLIAEFTGISSPYEVPVNHELTLKTGAAPLEACVHEVVSVLMERGIIPSAALGNF